MRTPLVSVAIPVYNGERFIAEAIESVLGQTTGDLELIVSDNASTDGTEVICRGYEASDPRVRYMRAAQNVGAAMNYRLGLQAATAPFFKWLAFDDYMDPLFLESCLRGFDGVSESVLVTASMPYVDELRNPLPYDADRGVYVSADGDVHVLVDPVPGIASADPSERFKTVILEVVHNLAAECFYGLIRSEALHEVRPHGLHIGADKILVAELSLRGPFLHLGQVLMYRRFHGENIGSRSLSDYSEQVGKQSTTRTIRISQALGYAGAIWKAPLPAKDKLRCSGSLLRKVTRTAAASR